MKTVIRSSPPIAILPKNAIHLGNNYYLHQHFVFKLINGNLRILKCRKYGVKGVNKLVVIRTGKYEITRVYFMYRRNYYNVITSTSQIKRKSKSDQVHQ